MDNSSKTIIYLLWLVAIALVYHNYSPQIQVFFVGENKIDSVIVDTWTEALNLNDQGLKIQKTDPELAEELYKQAIEKDSSFYYAYNNLGILYSDNGRQQEAFDMYQKAIQIKPDYAKAYNNLGVWYYDSGDRKKAMEKYEIAITFSKTDPNPYGNIALILDLEENNTKSAIPYYKKAIEFGSTNTTVINRAKELGV